MAKISIIPWIVKKLKRCIGIVEDTDTASQAIASNKYVIWKGDVCKSTSAISEGDTLSSSNLSAVTGGVGNDLAGGIANIPKLKYMDLEDTTPMNVNGKSGGTITVDNFVGCASRTGGLMPLPYFNNNVQYIKLVNYGDYSAFSGSATVRVWYI